MDLARRHRRPLPARPPRAGAWCRPSCRWPGCWPRRRRTLRQREYDALARLARAPVEHVAEPCCCRSTGSPPRPPGAPVDAAVRAAAAGAPRAVRREAGRRRCSATAWPPARPELARPARASAAACPSCGPCCCSQFTARRDVLKAHGALRRRRQAVLAAAPVRRSRRAAAAPGGDRRQHPRPGRAAASSTTCAPASWWSARSCRSAWRWCWACGAARARARLGLDAGSDERAGAGPRCWRSSARGRQLAESPVATQACAARPASCGAPARACSLDAELSGRPAL